MNKFTIRDIENLSGIKAHTLRAWEQRYKLFVPKRKESRHRVYDNDDLKELLRISYLYHHGYRVSRIACLTCEQIREEVEATCAKNENPELIIHQLIEASVDFDKEKFEKIVNTLIIRTGLENAILQVFYPFLQRIGLLWMTNNIIPAQEHFCSHIIRKKLICAIDGIDISATAGPGVLIFGPAGEHHELPLLTANYLLRRQNIRTTYFGTNLPLQSLCDYLDQRPTGYVYTHIISPLRDMDICHYLQAIGLRFPLVKIIVSGPAISCLRDLPREIKILKEPADLIQFAKSCFQAANQSGPDSYRVRSRESEV